MNNLNKKDYINKILLKMREEISFIEIKKGTMININKKQIRLKEKISFPIFVDELIGEIKKNKDFKGFNNKDIIEGMLFIIGIDPDFKLNKTYLSLFKQSNLNIEAYLISLINTENMNIDKKIVFCNSLLNIGEKNEKKYFVYGNVLEIKGSILKTNSEQNKAQHFINMAVKMYNKSLDENINFSLPYYKLGYYHKQNNQYINAKAYWNKFMEIDDNDIRKQEIREQLEELENFIKFEEGYKLVLKGHVEQGLDVLLPLLDVFKNWWKLFFVIGVAFRQKQDFEIAKRYFKNVIELKPGQIDAVNELAVCEMSLNNYEDAEKYLTEGIKINSKSHELYTNRAAANIYLNKIEDAEKDIKKALEIQPDNEVANILKGEIKKIKK